MSRSTLFTFLPYLLLPDVQQCYAKQTQTYSSPYDLSHLWSDQQNKNNQLCVTSSILLTHCFKPHHKILYMHNHIERVYT